MTDRWQNINPTEDNVDINGFDYNPKKECVYNQFDDIVKKQRSVMSTYNTYEEFVLYCLRSLGGPLLNIELDDNQIRDRVTDALQYFLEQHQESVDQFYFIYGITSEDIKQGYIQMPPHVLDVVRVSASNVQYSESQTTESGWTISPDGSILDAGGNLVGDGTSAIGGVTPGLAGYDVGNMSMDDWLLSPTFGFMANYAGMYYGSMNGGSISGGGFGGGPYGGNGLFYYELMMQQIELMKYIMTAEVYFSWRSREKKLYLYKEMKPQLIMICGNKMLDPENDGEVIFNSPWLKKYCSALMGVQWGTNLSKYGNLSAGGNITISGNEILARYQAEKEKLEENFNWRFAVQPMPRWA